jgi:murein DD-endopeptidase MepM/ murein hydrolase activator NlpD
VRRLGVALVLVVLTGTIPAAAGGRTFTIVSNDSKASQPASKASQPARLPSYTEPNGPGSISVPFALSTPPTHPAVLSYGELVDLWHRAGEAYGVPWQVLAAINKIESNFGSNMGPSSAGALGWMQFIPDSWMRWGMDGDGDGLASPWDPEDAVFSAARYLAAAGAHDDLSRAIFAYNHAQWYVDDVLELAAEFDSRDGDFAPGLGQSAAAFRLEALEERLAAARRRVTRAQRAIPRAERAAARSAQRVLVLERRAGDATLSTKRFQALESKIAVLNRAEARAYASVARHQKALDAAVAAVERLQDKLAAAAVRAPAFASAGLPDSVDGYVFPVGGGPDVVSVAHTHHDYPAADIAAPEGSPLYALANSTVEAAWPQPSGNCGIGFRIRVDGGPVYVYCHLSYLEPQVVPGAALAAGAPVGLVGSTGHSTGPHLHLQYSPAAAYPQAERWFKSFAGVAYSWQDAPTPKPKRPAAKPRARVFTVIAQDGDPFSSGVITFTR